MPETLIPQNEFLVLFILSLIFGWRGRGGVP